MDVSKKNLVKMHVEIELNAPSDIIFFSCVNSTQRARTDLNKRFLPKPMTTTG